MTISPTMGSPTLDSPTLGSQTLRSQAIDSQPSADGLAAKRVLIVDRSEESREVLRTMLERGGAEIWEASEASAGLALAEESRPHVIVLDLDGSAEDRAATYDGFVEQTERSSASLVVLGAIRRPAGGSGAGSSSSNSAAKRSGHVLAKPYHFAPLIHTIETLLAQAAAE